MKTAHYIEEADNELGDILQLYIQKAQNQESAEIYAFGQTWGPEEKTDMYFGFDPGKGIHDIHMNQGNKGKWINDNGTFQDGGLFLHFPKDDQWVAFFFAFQSQSFHTDDEGKPLFEADTSIEQSVRIVSALLNPRKWEPKIGIINRTEHTIQLDGWCIRDNHHSMPLSGKIKAGAYRHIALTRKFRFSDNGGILMLVNEHGQKIDGVCYSTPEVMTKGVTTVF